MDHNTDLVKRLDALETSIRQYRRGTLAVLLLAIAGVCLALGGEGTDTVRAKRFVLLDSEGREKGEWTTEYEGAAAMNLKDKHGKLRIQIHTAMGSTADSGTAGVFLLDKNRTRAQFAIFEDLYGFACFGRDKEQVTSGISSTGPFLLARDHEGKPLFELPEKR